MGFSDEKIETMIYQVRGQRVMLDSDLAKLYGVETKRLKEQVKRNLERFPNDFLVIPDFRELADLRSQIATLGEVSRDNYENIFNFKPYLFTENGVAMLSSILRSKEAIQVNIAIMRTFTKLRSFLALEGDGEARKFKLVFERLDRVETKLDYYIEAVTPKLPIKRKKIGLKD